jgi:hypothetical protein
MIHYILPAQRMLMEKLDGYNGEPFLDLYQTTFNKSNNSYSETYRN